MPSGAVDRAGSGSASPASRPAARKSISIDGNKNEGAVRVNKIGVFPFGQPILPVLQNGRTKKRVFVLGVYASAVHARWVGEDGRQKIAAVGVASEPEIFWRGSQNDAQEIIARIGLPPGAGRLTPASDHLNGPSGQALDERFLEPLGLSRVDAWLCDLIPHSCMNMKQAAALKREYDPLRDTLGLPAYDWPLLPAELTGSDRRMEIERELGDSDAGVVITLGDLPLKWFTHFYGSAAALSEYGQASGGYGRVHALEVGGRELKLLPLVHPRQAARLGTHSAGWAEVHDTWRVNPPRDALFT